MQLPRGFDEHQAEAAMMQQQVSPWLHWDTAE